MQRRPYPQRPLRHLVQSSIHSTEGPLAVRAPCRGQWLMCPPLTSLPAQEAVPFMFVTDPRAEPGTWPYFR